uniref:Helicase-associated domain-containing protein n=1 Tax=Arion vulgaris TaxID=1028688 RepID=A0A0B6YIZ1_9EUPU
MYLTYFIKQNRYMEVSQMSALEEVFISKASCKQRAGRAGRVRDGFCFRLYTQEQFKDLRAYTTPEILRVPLEELCLSIMKCQYGKPHEFLNGALDPPQGLAVSRAMTLLRDVGACRVDESSLTPLGHHLATLPVNVRIGKMLLLGAIFGCLEQIAIIAAAMTEKSPFVVPLSKRSEAEAAKDTLAVAYSDHITLYKAYHGWCKARHESRTVENSYISKNFLKRSTLLDIENVKSDLVRLVKGIGFDNRLGDTKFESSSHVLPSPGQVLSISTVEAKTDDLDATNISMIKAILTAGLYPQVGQVVTQPSVDITLKSVCMVETPQGIAQVHPFSVNKNLSLTNSWLVYHEKIRLTRVYIRDTTVVSPYALLLFGGAIDVQHIQRVVSLDDWIRFKAVAKTGVIFKEIREMLNDMLERKLREPSLNISGSHLISLLKELIRSEKTR